MTPAQRTICLLAIVTFGFIGRAATTAVPIFDHHSWRQADTAMIARNFAASRLNPLYPQVDHRGALPVGYVATGLELQAWLVALISKATGFAPQIGRLLSALWFVGSVLLVFALTRGRYGDAPALAAAFSYSFGFPLVLFIERAFLNEALLLCLSFAVLVAVCRRTRGAGSSRLLLACAGMACIGAVKPTFLIVAAGVFALYVERDGWRGLLRVEPYTTVACGILAASLWLLWASSLGRATGLTFGLTDKLFDAAVLFDHGYWVKVTRRLVKDLFGPIGIIAAALGIVAAWRARCLMEIALVLGGLVYLIVVTPGNYHHDYYQIPLVTGMTILAGVGLTQGLDNLRWFRTRTPQAQLIIRVIAFWLLPITTLVRSVSPHNW
jgi:4-amino-4-deoxy-L-arabinose transferase-like glycosyltransferase